MWNEHGLDMIVPYYLYPSRQDRNFAPDVSGYMILDTP